MQLLSLSHNESNGNTSSKIRTIRAPTNYGSLSTASEPPPIAPRNEEVQPSPTKQPTNVTNDFPTLPSTTKKSTKAPAGYGNLSSASGSNINGNGLSWQQNRSSADSETQR